MLMLLSVHVSCILFLVWFKNFTPTMGFYRLELQSGFFPYQEFLGGQVFTL